MKIKSFKHNNKKFIIVQYNNDFDSIHKIYKNYNDVGFLLRLDTLENKDEIIISLAKRGIKIVSNPKNDNQFNIENTYVGEFSTRKKRKRILTNKATFKTKK